MKIYFGIETTRMSPFHQPFFHSHILTLLSFCISTATVDAAAAKPADAATAGTVTAEDEASAKAAEAAMKEKIERLSGHMFAVM